MASRKTVKPRTIELKFKGLKCIGNICFAEDGSIIVKVPKKADPRCAKRIAQSILSGKRVNFEVEGKPQGKVDREESED